MRFKNKRETNFVIDVLMKINFRVIGIVDVKAFCSQYFI